MEPISFSPELARIRQQERLDDARRHRRTARRSLGERRSLRRR